MPWNDPNPMPYAQRVQVSAISTLAFFLLFAVSAYLLPRNWKRYREMSHVLQTDTVSRVNSTVHCIIVSICLFWGMTQNTWDENWFPITPGCGVCIIHFSFSVSFGYFVCDSICLWYYRSLSWITYVVHHICCLTAICTFLFFPSLNYGAFTFSLVFFMEYSLTHLNIQVFMQELGLAKTRLYSINLYWCALTWLLFRIGNPIVALYLIYTRQLRLVPDDVVVWMYPCLFCVWAVIPFCIMMFVTVIWREIRMRWVSAPEFLQVASPTLEQKGIEPFELSHMTTDEVDVTARSPTQQFIHMAEEKAKDMHLEERIHDFYDAALHAKKRQKNE